MKKTLFLLLALAFTLAADAPKKHLLKPCECDKPIIFDETEMEKIFELKGKVYKVLKGDETNPSILYVLDPTTDKFVRMKQQ